MERQGADPRQPWSDLGPDELDRSIDELMAGRVGHGEDGQDPVPAALLRVRALSIEPVPPEVRSRQLAAIRTHGPSAGMADATGATSWVPAWAGGLRRRIGTVTASVLGLVLVFGGSTVAVAQDAQADDALYGVKRVSEQAWLVLPRGHQRAAEVQLALAERRIGEARERPAFAEELVSEGLANVENAAEELPQEALANLARLLGDGEDALPATASPAARAALHRNCVRLAERHGLEADCGERPEARFPGRGAERPDGDGMPGFGPQGRPDGETGPPPWSRGRGPQGRPDGEVGPP